jgi:hypothetical protein
MKSRETSSLNPSSSLDLLSSAALRRVMSSLPSLLGRRTSLRAASSLLVASSASNPAPRFATASVFQRGPSVARYAATAAQQVEPEAIKAAQEKAATAPAPTFGSVVRGHKSRDPFKSRKF